MPKCFNILQLSMANNNFKCEIPVNLYCITFTMRLFLVETKSLRSYITVEIVTVYTLGLHLWKVPVIKSRVWLQSSTSLAAVLTAR